MIDLTEEEIALINQFRALERHCVEVLPRIEAAFRETMRDVRKTTPPVNFRRSR